MMMLRALIAAFSKKLSAYSIAAAIDDDVMPAPANIDAHYVSEL